MKGSAGSLVTLVSWLGSWIVSYAFNFLMTWSSAGKKFTPYLQDSSAWILITLLPALYFLFRNLLHILKHLWDNCSVCCQAGSGDEGPNTWRNTSIFESVVSKRCSWLIIRAKRSDNHLAWILHPVQPKVMACKELWNYESSSGFVTKTKRCLGLYYCWYKWLYFSI